MIRLALITAFALFVLSTNAQADPFAERISEFKLRDQTIFEAIAELSERNSDIAFSVENQLSHRDSGVPTIKRFTAEIQNATVSGILDWLVALDPRYGWSRDSNMANLFPRSVQDRSDYIFNRRLQRIEIMRAKDAHDAVMAVLTQIPEANDKPGFLQLGGSLTFTEPWSTVFEETSIREVFNAIARNLGKTYGWQYTGTDEFQFVMFHQRLLSRSRGQIRKASNGHQWLNGTTKERRFSPEAPTSWVPKRWEDEQPQWQGLRCHYGRAFRSQLKRNWSVLGEYQLCPLCIVSVERCGSRLPPSEVSSRVRSHQALSLVSLGNLSRSSAPAMNL